MKSGIITSLGLGRLGRFCNQAYTIAGILGIGRRNNLEPLFPKWRNWDAQERFGSKEDCDLFKHFVFPLPGIPEGTQFQPERWVDWGYHDVRLPPGNWNITAHLQSPKYFNFDDVMETVRHYFTMKDEGPLLDVCAIHRRAGDYTDGDGYHPRMDMRYYEKALAYFPANQRFLVFSDDIEAAKKMFGNGPNFDYSEGLDYIGDWRLLKRCTSFVISNSTFSSFPATISDAGGITVAPRPWFGKAYTPISGDDIYCSDWKIVQWE